MAGVAWQTGREMETEYQEGETKVVSVVAFGVEGDNKILSSTRDMRELVQSWPVTKSQGELGGGNFNLG